MCLSHTSITMTMTALNSRMYQVTCAELENVENPNESFEESIDRPL